MTAIVVPQNEDLVAREILDDVLGSFLGPLKEHIAKINDSVIALDRLSPIAQNRFIHFLHIGVASRIEEWAIAIPDDVLMPKLKMSVGPNPNITHF
jgi:hypothetical protein